MSLVLVGQTELMTKVKTMRQLYSRIKVKQYLECLKEGEILEYIEFKIRAVGYDRAMKTLLETILKKYMKLLKACNA